MTTSSSSARLLWARYQAVIGKEVRTLAANPEFRVVAIRRERRVLVPAVEQRTFAVRAEIRSLAA